MRILIFTGCRRKHGVVGGNAPKVETKDWAIYDIEFVWAEKDNGLVIMLFSARLLLPAPPYHLHALP